MRLPAPLVRRILALTPTLALTTLLASPAAQAFTLVAPDDVARAAQPPGAEEPFQAKAFGGPEIRLLAPQATASVRAPFRIEVRFQPGPDAHVRPETFKLLYGFMRIDLTDRIRAKARISDQGVIAEDAEVPAGNHRLFLRVADDKGRTSEQEVRLVVSDGAP